MLAADQVQNSRDSLYPIRPESKETPFRDVNKQQYSLWTLSSRDLGAFSSDVIYGVLSSRGWTLQERILAPRILHFGKFQVHWECPTTLGWERTDFKCAFYTPPILDDARDAMIALNLGNTLSTSTRITAGIGRGRTRYTL